VVKGALKDRPEGSLAVLLSGLPQDQADRVEMKVSGVVEDLLARLKTTGSAGHAMVALSQTADVWPDPE